MTKLKCGTLTKRYWGKTLQDLVMVIDLTQEIRTVDLPLRFDPTTSMDFLTDKRGEVC